MASSGELAAANALPSGTTRVQQLTILSEKTAQSLARQTAQIKNEAARKEEEAANRAFDEKTKNVNAMIEQVSSIGKITEGEKQHLSLLESINRITAQTNAIGYRTNAVFLNRDGREKAEGAAISAKAYADRAPGESDEDVQAKIAALKQEAKAERDLQDATAAAARIHNEELEHLQGELDWLQRQREVYGDTEQIMSAILSVQKDIAKTQDQTSWPLVT